MPFIWALLSAWAPSMAPLMTPDSERSPGSGHANANVNVGVDRYARQAPGSLVRPLPCEIRRNLDRQRHSRHLNSAQFRPAHFSPHS